MDTNRMRLGLAYIFKESTQIGKASKIQLINFIEQASEHQLKILALDGELVHSKMIDESTKEIVDERFEASPHIIESLKKASLQGLNELAKKKSVIKEESVLAIIKTYGLDASKKYNACMAKAKKEKWFSKNRSLAVALCKQQDYAYNAQQLMKNIGMCKKAKDPEKCKKHVKQMAFVNKSEADKYGAKVNKLKSKMNK